MNFQQNSDPLDRVLTKFKPQTGDFKPNKASENISVSDYEYLMQPSFQQDLHNNNVFYNQQQPVQQKHQIISNPPLQRNQSLPSNQPLLSQNFQEWQPSPYSEQQAQPQNNYLLNQQHNLIPKTIRPRNQLIQFEDPIEKKRREREERIQQERAEMAALINPFSQLGNKPVIGGRRGIQSVQTLPESQTPIQLQRQTVDQPEQQIQKSDFPQAQQFAPVSNSITIDHIQREARHKKQQEQRAILEQQVQERNQKKAQEKQRLKEQEILEEQRIKREIEELNREQEIAREKEGLKVKTTQIANRQAAESINQEKFKTKIESTRISTQSLTPASLKTNKVSGETVNEPTHRPDSRASRSSVIQAAGQQLLYAQHAKSTILIAPLTPSTASYSTVNKGQEFLLQEMENKFRDELNRMQQEMIAQKEDFEQHLRIMREEAQKNQNMRLILEQRFKLQQQQSQDFNYNNGVYDYGGQPSFYNIYEGKPATFQEAAIHSKQPQVVLIKHGNNKNNAADQKIPVYEVANSQALNENINIVSNQPFQQILQLASEFIPKPTEKLEKHDPYINPNRHIRKEQQIDYDQVRSQKIIDDLEGLDDDTREQLMQIESLNQEGHSTLLNLAGANYQALVSLDGRYKLPDLNSAAFQHHIQKQLKTNNAVQMKENVPIEIQNQEWTGRTSVSQKQHYLDIQTELQEARNRVSYTDSTSPFYQHLPGKSLSQDADLDQGNKQFIKDSDLVKQFQAAAQNFSPDQEQEVKQIKQELLKMRNLPSLDEILEQADESGTQTFLDFKDKLKQ